MFFMIAILIVYVIIGAVIGTFLMAYSAHMLSDVVQEKDNNYKFIKGFIYAGIAFIWLITIWSLSYFVISLF